MKICGKLNDFENSYKLLNEMKENNINFNLIIMTCYIKTCLNTNHVVEGINTFKEMTKYNIYPDNIAYTTIISGIINNFELCDYSDELINFLKKSIEEGIHINKNLFVKSFYYLNILGHKDKADAFNEYLKEKNLLNNFNSKEKGSNGSKSNSNDSNNSNESTNNKTANSTITNFNSQGLNYNYSYLNTINALNMCYYQKFFMDKNNMNMNNISTNSAKKETPLKEIFDNNKIYPFVYKSKEKEKNEDKDKDKAVEENKGSSS